MKIKIYEIDLQHNNVTFHEFKGVSIPSDDKSLETLRKEYSKTFSSIFQKPVEISFSYENTELDTPE